MSRRSHPSILRKFSVVAALFIATPGRGQDAPAALSQRLYPVQLGLYAWGFMSPNCEVVIRGPFDEVRPFAENLAAVRRADRWGYIDPSGRERIPFQFQRALDFSEGLALVRTREGRRSAWVYIDTTGTIALAPPSMEEPTLSFEQLGYIDVPGHDTREGTLPLSRALESDWQVVGFLIAGFSQGLAAVQRGRKWGFVDRAGTVVIEPSYEAALRFSDGLAAVKVDGKWGYIDRHGRMRIEPQFRRAQPFVNGRAVVATGPIMRDKYGIIDTTGAAIVPARLPFAYAFEAGLVRVDIKSGFAKSTTYFIDAAGDTVLRLDNAAFPLDVGGGDPFLALVQHDRSGRVYIDKAGAITCPLWGK